MEQCLKIDLFFGIANSFAFEGAKLTKSLPQISILE